MLVPMFPVKTLAKMLLILMMGPASKPLSISIPTLRELTNGYYELRVPDTDKCIFFSRVQLQSILNALPSESQFSMRGKGMDLNKLAAYIVSNNLLTIGCDQLPRVYDDRSSASSGPRNTFIIGANESQHNHNMITHERTISSDTIAEHAREKNIHELMQEQKDLLHMSKMPCKDQDTKNKVEKFLIQVNTSLIDLGYLTIQKLRDNRELLKRGKISVLIARLDKIDKLLKRSWPIQRVNGGSRQLHMEKYYLGKVLKDPFVKAFHLVTEGGFMEARGGIKKLNELWRGLNAEQREACINFLGFSPIPQADYLISKRPDRAQIIPEQPQDICISPEILESILTDMHVDLMTIPVQDQIIRSLETAPNVDVLTEQLSTVANQVFSHYRNLDIYSPVVEDLVNESIQIIKTTENPHTMIWHIVLVNHALSDLQDIVQQRPSLLERSPGIIVRGACTFVLRCNPVGQALATVEFWAGMAHFGWDVSVGRLYQSPDVYQARKDNFCKSMNALSVENLAQLDAEGWMHIGATTLADFIYGRLDMSATIKYLQTLEQIGSTGQKALVIADHLRKGVDIVMTKNPLVIVKNRATDRLAQGIDEIKAPVTKVVSTARALLESEYAKLVVELEWEIATLRPIFDLTRKGFGTFANKNIKINYKHILGMDIKFYPDKIDFSGFHHDLMGAIEKSGVVQFANKVVHKTGVYSADIIVNGKLIRDKTFFPMIWSRKQVVEAITEVYDNFKNVAILQPGGKWLIEGTTKEGVKIRMFITENALITSAFPVL